MTKAKPPLSPHAAIWLPTAGLRLIRAPVPPLDPAAGGVAVLGNFDGLHCGHRELFRIATAIAQRQGCQVMVMSAEPHPVSFFGRATTGFRLNCERMKLALLADCGIGTVYSPQFDAAFAALTPAEFVDRILIGAMRARHVVVGDDFHFGAARAGTVALLAELCATHGMTLTVVPEVRNAAQRCSSSNIRQLIARGEMRAAARMLGHPWGLLARAGTTEHHHLSLTVAAELQLPLEGSYVVQVLPAGQASPCGPARLEVRTGRLWLAGAEQIPPGSFVVLEFPADRLDAAAQESAMHRPHAGQNRQACRTP